MLRELLVDRRRWMPADHFEHAIAACNLLPGPASTQLAIYTAWTLRGTAGALVGGAMFILPGLVLIIGLAALFLGSPPDWIRGAGAGAGAAVAAVAVHAGIGLVEPSRAAARSLPRWLAYAVLGGAAAATVGAWVVLVLLGSGVAEVLSRRAERRSGSSGRDGDAAAHSHALPLAAAVPLLAAGAGGLGALCWTAFKVGALSYGGGFVIVPLMQRDAVDVYDWMTGAEFLNAVALGQVTPGPVTHTIAAVGYAAAGVGGALLATAVAFAPSFLLVLAGARRFEGLRRNETAQAFLGGAGPAAIGAILGVSVPLALALTEPWQWAILAAAAIALLVLRLGVVLTLLAAAAAGAAVALLGGPLP
jgi:chromate transporter